MTGNLGRYQTSRTEDDYTQAGVRYRSFQDWERDDLIANLVGDMKQCPEAIQLRMVWHFLHADEITVAASLRERASTSKRRVPCRRCPGVRPRASVLRPRPTRTAPRRTVSPPSSSATVIRR